MEAFWDGVSCSKYTKVNNCVVRGVLAENRLFQKLDVLFKKASIMHSKLLQIVYLHCCSSFLFLFLRKQNLDGKFMSFDHPCTTAPRFSLCMFVLYFCLVFCSCSLTHTAAASWSIWTTDHAHFRIP